VKQSNGQPITLESKAEKYAAHLMGESLDDGFLPGWRRTINYLRSHGLDGDEGRRIARKYQLGFVNPAEPADRRFAQMLAIPYVTQKGVVDIKYRCTLDHDCRAYAREHDPMHAKYGKVTGSETWIFNPRAFFDADDTLGVAEGEIDAIVATEYLGIPTIGIPGVEAWTAYGRVWKHLLREDYAKVLVFVDGDEPSQSHPDGAGIEFARAVAQDVGPVTHLVRCLRGEDVASMVASGRGDILRERAGLI
jgi:hypothetical protein